jgi:endonuclease YncB( thermonuclease family)
MHPAPAPPKRPQFGWNLSGIFARRGSFMPTLRRGAIAIARPPMRGPLAAVLLALVTPALALAAPDSRRTRSSSADCTLEAVASGTVASVIDGRTFVLADGREVRLPSIEIPPLPEPTPAPAAAPAADPAIADPPPAHPSESDPNRVATDALKDLLAGRPVALRASKLVTDRYGRTLADALVTREGYPGSIEKTLLSQGLARLAPGAAEPGCMAELRAAERLGRSAKLGLWGDPRYIPRAAENVVALSAERGRFTLVEGKVVSVRESGGTIYLNFGQHWSEDFTVTILKRNERQFIEAGLRPSGLTGRRVMVRGWIEERGGPWIEATEPEQIEVIADR